MVQYRETVELKVPLYVLRGLVTAAEHRTDVDEQTETNFLYAIKWLADRPIYREQTLNADLVEAVYARLPSKTAP